MAKRTGLGKLEAAAQAKAGIETEEAMITTGISIKPSHWQLLQDVAHARKKKEPRGSRISASRIIAEMIERHRAELEAELKA